MKVLVLNVTEKELRELGKMAQAVICFEKEIKTFLKKEGKP